MDAVAVVKNFLRMAKGRKLKLSDLDPIMPALDSIYERYLKIQKAGITTIELSDEIQVLFAIAGKKGFMK